MFVVVQSHSCVQLFRPHGVQHTRLPCPSPFPGVFPSSCPLNWWCHPAISSSVTLFSFCLQSFQASESFPMSQLFASAGQSIEVSALLSVFPKSIQGWFPVRFTSFISLLSKWLSRVFSTTTVWKHQLFGILPSLLSNSHAYTWLLERPSLDYRDLFNLKFNMLSRFIITSAPRSNCLLISWPQSPFAVEPKKKKSATASIFSPSICHEVMEPDTMILVLFFVLFCF